MKKNRYKYKINTKLKIKNPKKNYNKIPGFQLGPFPTSAELLSDSPDLVFSELVEM